MQQYTSHLKKQYDQFFYEYGHFKCLARVVYFVSRCWLRSLVLSKTFCGYGTAVCVRMEYREAQGCAGMRRPVGDNLTPQHFIISILMLFYMTAGPHWNYLQKPRLVKTLYYLQVWTTMKTRRFGSLPYTRTAPYPTITFALSFHRIFLSFFHFCLLLFSLYLASVLMSAA